MNKVLEIYVITWSPRDAPGMFVLRRQCVVQDERTLRTSLEVDPHQILVSCCLEEVREAVPFGLFRMPRQPNDDPVILETWF